MRSRKFYLIFLIIGSLFFFRCKSYEVNDLSGKYVNRNYEYTPFLPEIPYTADTLTLLKDLTFSSSFWGNGVYEIKNSVKGSFIKLTYNYEFGRASCDVKVIEDDEGNPKIMLFEEKNHHYLKIE